MDVTKEREKSSNYKKARTIIIISGKRVLKTKGFTSTLGPQFIEIKGLNSLGRHNKHKCVFI